MDKARVYVDLNEMVTDDIVLLSKNLLKRAKAEVEAARGNMMMS